MAAVELDPAKLRQELAELAEKRGEVVERIRSMPGAARGRGRGFGSGFAPGRGWQGGRMPGRPGSFHDGPRDVPPPEPRPRPRVAAWGLANGSGGAPQWKPPLDSEDANQQPLGARLGPGPSTPRDAPSTRPVEPSTSGASQRPRLMSMVVVAGTKRTAPQPDAALAAAQPVEHEAPGIAKRPVPVEDDTNPAAKKRARRLFGALMGTLAKASQEEQQFRTTTVGQRREEALKRAEQRAVEQQKAAREAARLAEIAQRQAEVAKHRELGALAQTKRMELILAERYRREAQLSNFIRTTKSPPLHWLPAKHCEETLELLQKEQQRLEAWKADEVAKLETEKERILQRLPSFAKPAANGGADRPEDGQAEDGAQDGERHASTEHEPAAAAQDEERPSAAHEDASERWEPDASPASMDHAGDAEELDYDDDEPPGGNVKRGGEEP